VLPTVVTAAAFGALIGPRGLLNTALMNGFGLAQPPIQLERTLTLILIAHVFYNYAVALRIISSYWANLNPRIEEAARVLGAHGWHLMRLVWLPLLRPAILAAAALVFIFTFTSFGVVLILGGPQFATVEVEIYRQAAHLFNLPTAAALSLIQMAAMFGLMAVYTRLQRRISLDIASAEQIVRSPRTRFEKMLVRFNVALIVLLILMPLAALALRSVTVGGDGLTVRYYHLLTINTRDSVLFVPPLAAVLNSLIFAGATTILAGMLGLMTAYLLSGRVVRGGRWLDPLFMLPLAASAVTLGFGYIVAFDEPPLNLRTSPLLVWLAHTLVALPFVVRSVLPALRRIPPSLNEAARVMGAPPLRVWWAVDLPLIRRGLIVGATFAFTVSMGEFGASLFITRPEMPTMPVVIFRLLGQPGVSNYGQALAMSVVLMAVTAAGFVLIERLRLVGVGEF
jgi:thiamine transport system permease protein